MPHPFLSTVEKEATVEDLTPRTETVHIYQGDDLARMGELENEIDVASIEPLAERVNRVAGAPGTSAAAIAAASRYQDFVDEAKDRAYAVVVEALPRKKWREVRTLHPPRDDEPMDTAYGFNVDTIGEDLVLPSIITVTHAGAQVLGTDREREKFLDRLSEGDWSRLVSAAVKCNVGDGLPKDDMLSRISQMYGATSKSPPDSD